MKSIEASCSEQEMKSGDVEHDRFADAFRGVDALGNSGVAIRHVEARDILDVVVLTGISNGGAVLQF